MTDKVFYKKLLRPTESGLVIVTQHWVSIHETPSFHYCIHDYSSMFASWRPLDRARDYSKRNNVTMLQAAKKLMYKVKRVHKGDSRFAFSSESTALEHLRFLKRKQLSHMERDIAFVRAFLDADSLEPGSDGCAIVPATQELVLQHYRFD